MATKIFCYFIINVDSFRGSEYEIRQLNIQQQISQIEFEPNKYCQILTLILVGMIIKIKEESERPTQIVLYFGCECRYLIDAKYMIDQIFENDNIQVLVGQQSLFYLLGKMSKEVASIRCISKEKLFFSQSLMQTTNIVGDEYELKVYPLFEFENAIKLTEFIKNKYSI